MNTRPAASVAYFSMEVGLDARIPTYAGGLGVLAGDTLRSAADLGVPMVCVTLLHRKGYFRQVLDQSGRQSENSVDWSVAEFMVEQPERAVVSIEGRPVNIRCWRYEIRGHRSFVPVYLLDTDLPGNAEWDRTLTHYLYGGDSRYRFCQECVLGIGGVRMLRALGFLEIDRFHMNEGHSSLLVMELLAEQLHAAGRRQPTDADVRAVRSSCVFTTHTPVAAGHDQFPMDTARQVLGESPLFSIPERCCLGGLLNLTYLALNFPESEYLKGLLCRLAA